MNSRKPYEDFAGCFNEAKDIIVSYEELQKKMNCFNDWFESLDLKTRSEIAAPIIQLLSQAQEVIRNKQAALENMILSGYAKGKANSLYGKYE